MFCGPRHCLLEGKPTISDDDSSVVAKVKLENKEYLKVEFDDY